MKKLIVLFWLIGLLGFSQENLLFDQANTLYNKGEYQAAISMYNKIINNGFHSSALYFNMANCYYKSNEIAPSIYYYEKALKLSPYDEETLNNYSFAKQMTIDKFDNVPEVEVLKLYEKMAGFFNVFGWSIFCILTMWVFVLLFIAYYRSETTKSKRAYFILSVFSVLNLTLGLALLNKKLNLDNKRFAVVFSQEVASKSEPNLKSETVFILHEGAKIQILESYKKEWSKIKLIDGKSGWLPNQVFKEL